MFDEEWLDLEKEKNPDQGNNSETNNGEANDGETNDGETNDGETNDSETNDDQENNSETKNAETNNAETNDGETKNSGKPSFFSLIKDPTVYKPSTILLFLLLFQQACCIYPLSAFVRHVVSTISKPMENYKDIIFIVLSTIRLVISFVTTLFLSRFNQKQLLTISWVGMAVCGFGLAGIQWLKPSSLDVNLIGLNDWLLVFCLVLYIAFGGVGALGVPWTIIFELLPTTVRGRLGPCFVAFGYLVMAGFLSEFENMLDHFGVVCIFSFIGLLNLAGYIFIRYYVTETRGKPLGQIQKGFAKKASQKHTKSRRDSRKTPSNRATS